MTLLLIALQKSLQSIMNKALIYLILNQKTEIFLYFAYITKSFTKNQADLFQTINLYITLRICQKIGYIFLTF